MVLKKLLNILGLTSLHHFCLNLVTSASCDVIIKSVYNNSNSKNKNRSWHAVNETTTILSKHEETIWSVDRYALPLNSNSASFKVKKTKNEQLIGLYLCVKNETYISLCKKDNKNKLDKCKSVLLKFNEGFCKCTIRHVVFLTVKDDRWAFPYQIVWIFLIRLNLFTFPLESRDRKVDR